ncbi:hypothetical protein C8Q76DRAFT_383865 [Earliella scabrosa]|nr:hypothetical protein C8Q76DRAFT_383865 [Earliella scabrosa]
MPHHRPHAFPGLHAYQRPVPMQQREGDVGQDPPHPRRGWQRLQGDPRLPPDARTQVRGGDVARRLRAGVHHGQQAPASVRHGDGRQDAGPDDHPGAPVARRRDEDCAVSPRRQDLRRRRQGRAGGHLAGEAHGQADQAAAGHRLSQEAAPVVGGRVIAWQAAPEGTVILVAASPKVRKSSRCTHTERL